MLPLEKSGLRVHRNFLHFSNSCESVNISKKILSDKKWLNMINLKKLEKITF